MKPLISGKTTASVQDQLKLYAERVVHDRHSIDVLEAFLAQMSTLFNNIYKILYSEANAAAGIAENKPVQGIVQLISQHNDLREQLSRNLSEFIVFIKRIMDLAQGDDKFLKRNKKLIASMIAEGQEHDMFLKSADTGIEDEEQYLKALKYLEGLRKSASKLIKDLDKIKQILEDASSKNKMSEKNVALIESARFSAEAMLKKINEIEKYMPGLRNLDADSARTLGMLSDIV